MIESIKLQNFKNLRDQTIPLERFTVFVGANGSGKTSVLDAIQLVVRAAVEGPEKVFSGNNHCDWLFTRGAATEMLLSFSTPGGTLSVRATPPATPPPTIENLGKRSWAFEVFSDVQHTERALDSARTLVFFHLNASDLAKPSYSEQVPPRVEFDGGGLASVLSYMALNNPDGFETLTQHMVNFIPQLKRVRFTKEPIQRFEVEYVKINGESVEQKRTRTFMGDALLFDFNNAENVAAHTVSEGTILLLGLLTILLGPTQPQVLLLDDLEHGLHPLAQKALLDALKQVMATFDGIQIIASAHSPWLLDRLQPEQIRLMALDAKGHAVCGKLSDHRQFDKWKEEMAPGELWSLFGEKWLVEGGAGE